VPAGHAKLVESLMEVCLTIDDAAEKIVMERSSAPTGLTADDIWSVSGPR